MNDDPQIVRDEAMVELGKAWREVAIANRRLRGRDARQGGELSVPQYMLISALLDAEECSSGELAEQAGLTAATATHMLEQLAREGIVGRKRSPVDRRVVVTRLTPKGRERVARKKEALSGAWTAVVEDLDDEALVQAAAVLRRMVSYVNRL